jgi:hypothetical protein
MLRGYWTNPVSGQAGVAGLSCADMDAYPNLAAKGRAVDVSYVLLALLPELLEKFRDLDANAIPNLSWLNLSSAQFPSRLGVLLPKAGEEERGCCSRSAEICRFGASRS